MITAIKKRVTLNNSWVQYPRNTNPIGVGLGSAPKGAERRFAEQRNLRTETSWSSLEHQISQHPDLTEIHALPQ